MSAPSYRAHTLNTERGWVKHMRSHPWESASRNALLEYHLQLKWMVDPKTRHPLPYTLRRHVIISSQLKLHETCPECLICSQGIAILWNNLGYQHFNQDGLLRLKNPLSFLPSSASLGAIVEHGSMVSKWTIASVMRLHADTAHGGRMRFSDQ